MNGGEVDRDGKKSREDIRGENDGEGDGTKLGGQESIPEAETERPRVESQEPGLDPFAEVEGHGIRKGFKS